MASLTDQTYRFRLCDVETQGSMPSGVAWLRPPCPLLPGLSFVCRVLVLLSCDSTPNSFSWALSEKGALAGSIRGFVPQAAPAPVGQSQRPFHCPGAGLDQLPPVSAAALCRRRFGVLGAVSEFSVLCFITQGLIASLGFLLCTNRHHGGPVTVAGLFLPAYISGFVGTHGVL